MVKEKENLEKAAKVKHAKHLSKQKHKNKRTTKPVNLSILMKKERKEESKPAEEKDTKINIKTETYKENRPRPKPNKLLFAKMKPEDSDTSDEDEWMSSGSSLDNINLLEDPTNVCEVTPCDKVTAGDFVLVQFTGGKRNSTHFKYVTIVQDVFPDGEILVISLKKNNEEKTVFSLLEDDVSTITTSQMIGKLPTPEMKGTENRVKYVLFEKPVEVFEA